MWRECCCSWCLCVQPVALCARGCIGGYWQYQWLLKALFSSSAFLYCPHATKSKEIHSPHIHSQVAIWFFWVYEKSLQLHKIPMVYLQHKKWHIVNQLLKHELWWIYNNWRFACKVTTWHIVNQLLKHELWWIYNNWRFACKVTTW